MKKAADVSTVNEEDDVEDDVFLSPALSVHNQIQVNDRPWPSRQPNTSDVKTESNSTYERLNEPNIFINEEKVQTDFFRTRFGRVNDESLNSYMDVTLPNQIDITSLYCNSRSGQNLQPQNMKDLQPLMTHNKLPPLQAEHLASVRLPQNMLVDEQEKSFADSIMTQPRSQSNHENKKHIMSRDNVEEREEEHGTSNETVLEHSIDAPDSSKEDVSTKQTTKTLNDPCVRENIQKDVSIRSICESKKR